MIKPPIEWNALAEDFLDADGCLITAEDVADALNTAADQSRVIEVMTERIERLRDEIRLAIKETSQHYTVRRLGLALADDTAKMLADDDKEKI